MGIDALCFDTIAKRARPQPPPPAPFVDVTRCALDDAMRCDARETRTARACVFLFCFVLPCRLARVLVVVTAMRACAIAGTTTNDVVVDDGGWLRAPSSARARRSSR
jgi:hypothetical protein